MVVNFKVFLGWMLSFMSGLWSRCWHLCLSPTSFWCSNIHCEWLPLLVLKSTAPKGLAARRRFRMSPCVCAHGWINFPVFPCTFAATNRFFHPHFFPPVPFVQRGSNAPSRCKRSPNARPSCVKDGRGPPHLLQVKLGWVNVWRSPHTNGKGPGPVALAAVFSVRVEITMRNGEHL